MDPCYGFYTVPDAYNFWTKKVDDLKRSILITEDVIILRSLQAEFSFAMEMKEEVISLMNDQQDF